MTFQHSGLGQHLVEENDEADGGFEVSEEGAESFGFEKAETEYGCVVGDSVRRVLVVVEELVGEAVVIAVAGVDTVVVGAVGHVAGGMGRVGVVGKDTAAEIGTEQAKQPQPHPDSAWVVPHAEHTAPEAARQGHQFVEQY